MLVELLIIKNVKSVGGVINWVQVTFCSLSTFQEVLRPLPYLGKRQTLCICSTADIQTTTLSVHMVLYPEKLTLVLLQQ